MNYFKKIFLTLISLILLFSISVYSRGTINPYRTRPQSNSAPEQKTIVSAGYVWSNLNFSTKAYDTGSIITWRDIRLHGAQVNIDFAEAPFGDKTSIGLNYSVSSQGYSTDDDANNYFNSIDAASAKASSFGLAYEVMSESEKIWLAPKLGIDFNCLKLKAYDSKLFTSGPNYFQEGLVAKYDIYKLGLYGGIQAKLIESGPVQLNVSGQVGVGAYLALADWIHRSDLKHPVSFYDMGLTFRTGGEVEVLFDLDKFFIFGKMQAAYEVSPGIGLHNQRFSNGDRGCQRMFFELSQIAFQVGAKADF